MWSVECEERFALLKSLYPRDDDPAESYRLWRRLSVKAQLHLLNSLPRELQKVRKRYGSLEFVGPLDLCLRVELDNESVR